MKFDQYVFKINWYVALAPSVIAADGTTVINHDVTTLTYGANTPSINGIGFSAANYSDPSTVFSEQLTNDAGAAAVPEPSTWAMMVAGFAGLGFLSYRRTRRNGGMNFRFA
jgi:hypothetical protein